MSPNLYDVLDVEPDASADEIRAAWKAAIADLGPGDRRFRAYNQAAEVLLDPERRAAYDAELAADEAEPDTEPDTEPAAVAEPEAEPEPEPEPEADPEPEPQAADQAADPPAVGDRPAVATWMLAVVAVVAVAMLVTTVLMWRDHASGEDDAAPRDAEKTAAAALEAAELAAGPVLSYDYRTFDEGITDAQSYMTPGYRTEHSELMDQLRPIVEQRKVTVNAEFKGSAVVRVTGNRADILVMVNQVKTEAGAKGVVLPVWGTLQMVEDDDGNWLVDQLINSQTPIAG